MFLDGIFAGLAVAMPFGAIAVLIVDRALRSGFVTGVAAAAGAAFADTIFAALAVLGAGVAQRVLPEPVILQLLAGVVLCSVGLHGLWNAGRRAVQETREESKQNLLRTFVVLALITASNPMTIAFFGVLALARGVDDGVSLGAGLLFAIGAGFSSIVWQTGLVGMAALAGQVLTPKMELLLRSAGQTIVLSIGLMSVASAMDWT